MMKIANALVLLACLAPVGCVVTSGPPVAPSSRGILYYYGGAHFYPGGFGGEWCGLGEPHAHDFPPDRPDCYAHDAGYYYYTGCNGETHPVGRVPAGATVHVPRPHAPHEPAAVPPHAPRAPHIATGQLPTRATHPAPAQPTPAQPAPAQPIPAQRPPAASVPRPVRPPSSRPVAVPVRPAPHPTPAVPAPAPTAPARPEPVRPVPPRAEPTPPAPPPTPPAPPPKRAPDPRDPKDDNATKPKPAPDPRDPKDDNAQRAPDAPLRYTPPAKRKDAPRLAPPTAPKPR